MAWMAKFAAGQTKFDSYELASLEARIQMICKSSKHRPVLLTFELQGMLQHNSLTLPLCCCMAGMQAYSPNTTQLFQLSHDLHPFDLQGIKAPARACHIQSKAIPQLVNQSITLVVLGANKGSTDCPT